MFSAALKKGFFDELRKISAVNLNGLSPETLLSQKPPDPMETPGSKKALDVLDLAAVKKMASVKEDLLNGLVGPTRRRVWTEKKSSVSSPAMQLRSSQQVGAPVATRAKKGPGIKEQIRGTLVGRKGTLPPQ